MGHGLDAILRLNVTYLLDGQNCVNSFWFRTRPTDPSLTLQEDCDWLIAEWDGIMWPIIKPLMNINCQNIAAVAQAMTGPGAAITISSYSTRFGQVTGDSLPSFCAAVLSFYTAYTGRRTHGRTYFPGISESDVAGSVLVGTAPTRLTSIASTFIGRYGLAGSNTRVWGVVYSRKNGVSTNPGPPPFLNYSPLAGVPWYRCVTHNEIGTQRHRKLHRGV